MLWSYRLVGVATLLANGATLFLAGAPVERPAIAAAVAPVRLAPAHGATAAERNGDGLFHLTGRNGDRSARFVVDTGASVTVLTAADAARLGAEPIKGEAAGTLQTAGGRTAMAWHRLPSFEIAGQRIGAIEVAVVQKGIGRSLLGQDVLAQLGTIVIADDRLEVRPRRD